MPDNLLITLKTLPPGGWRFEQKSKDGRIIKLDGMGPFWDHVHAIQTYRKSNGITPDDEQSISYELQAQTCARLGNDPKWCDSQKKTLLRRLSVLPAHVREAAQRVENVSNGARILVDWLGDGAVPVPISLAQSRTNICLCAGTDGTPCPENIESHGVMQLTDKIAEAILEQRRKKKEMNLFVDGEKNLHTCRVCACHLPLKVHVPMDVIIARTSEKLLKRFPSYCWMRTENEKTPNQKEVCESASLPTLS